MTHSMLARYAVNRNLCVLSHFFLRPPLQNSLSFDMMCVKMQRERREKPMSPQNHDTQDYYDRPPVRRKRRKKTPWQKFKELTSRYCCSYWASRNHRPHHRGVKADQPE